LPYGRTLHTIYLCGNEPTFALGVQCVGVAMASPSVRHRTDRRSGRPHYGGWQSRPAQQASLNAFPAVNLCANQGAREVRTLERSRYVFGNRQA